MTSLADVVFNGIDTTWLDDAACADMDESDFFVNAGHTIDPEVVTVCRGCPVRLRCLDHAYDPAVPLLGSGYFAGLSPGQRKRMTHEQAREFVIADTEAFKRDPRR